MEKVCKLMQLGRIKSFEGEKDDISKYVTDMDYFGEGEIVPFTALLANNVRDRQLDRFPKKALEIFEKTIIGKMRLLNHDSKERTGRFYNARILKKSIDEVLPMFDTVHFPDIKKHLSEIEGLDGGLYFLETKFYMLNKTPKQQENTSNVIGGIDAFMSISFTGFKVVPVYEETEGEQVLKYWEYQLRDGFPAEALEGSAVFLGAQYAAQITSSKSFATTDVQAKWVEPEEIEDDQIREICNQLDALIVKGITDVEMNGELSFVEEEKAKWTTAYINSLEDNCFAFIEPGGKKDDEGKTVPRNYRHGPHHKKGQGAPGTGGTVDLPHLRNLLARADQIKPASGKISQSELIKKVKNHAIAHAKKLGVGDYKEYKETNTMEEIILSIPSLGIAKTVKPEEKEWQSEIETGIKNKMKELEGDVAFAAQVRKIFGENVETSQIEQIKKDADAYKKSEVERALKFGSLTKMIADDEKEAKKKWLESLPVAQVTEWADHYQEDYKAKNPGTPQVKNDNNNVPTLKDATQEDFKRSMLSGYQAN